MQRYTRVTGCHPHAEPADGRFNGVGGKVSVVCRRSIPIHMRALDQDYVPGMIMSIELENSDAPLLLSSAAQRKLGLVLDMGAHTAYGKVLDKELELVDYNGLPALKLLPGDYTAGNIVLSATQENVDAEMTAGLDELMELESQSDVDVTSLPLDPKSTRNLNKKQRKHLYESRVDLAKEDCALWSSLTSTPRRPSRMLPRGCKTFLMEVFAGAATLSCLVAQAGLPISQPIDVLFDSRFDLLKKENRDRMEKVIQEDDPYLLTLAPVCGPWSSWQFVNMAKDEATREKIELLRKQWYPVLKWLRKVIKDRLRKGREILLENPWPSMLWKLPFMEDLYTGDYVTALTEEKVERLRLDQCMYGLTDDYGQPHRKATGMLLSSRSMKMRLHGLCDGQHDHVPLEGGSLTKKAQEWPLPLRQAIMEGALEEMQNQVMLSAFAGEYQQEEHEEMGPLDSIITDQDVAEPFQKRRRLDLDELSREEDFEEPSAAKEIENDIINAKEKHRRDRWLRLDRQKRVAIRRLHTMMGHCSTQALVRMLKASGVEKSVLDAVVHFRCPTCEELLAL